MCIFLEPSFEALILYTIRSSTTPEEVSVYTRPCSERCSAAVSRCPTCRSGAPSTSHLCSSQLGRGFEAFFWRCPFTLCNSIFPMSVCLHRGGVVWWWCSNVLPGDNSRSFSDPYHLSPIQARFLISFKWCSFKLATSSCAR